MSSRLGRAVTGLLVAAALGAALPLAAPARADALYMSLLTARHQALLRVVHESEGSPATAADVGVVTIGLMDVPRLTVTPWRTPGSHVVGVTGVLTTSASPQQLTELGYNFQIRLWGDDFASDDLLDGPYAPRLLTADPKGVRYTSRRRYPNSRLNEDLIGGDELHVEVRLISPSGRTIRKMESLPFHGSF
jgi:hypothetical protein